VNTKSRPSICRRNGHRAEKNKANEEITALLKAKKDTEKKIASMKTIANKIECDYNGYDVLDIEDRLVLSVPRENVLYLKVERD
jgi:hypothetical protein